MFIGLNPSTATATKADPTVRRCIGFAHDWNFGSLVVVNLFAWRSTCPAILAKVVDPIGPRNNWWLSFYRSRVDLIVAVWGVHGSLMSRDEDVIASFPDLHCLGVTRDGHPKHPLYLPSRSNPKRFQRRLPFNREVGPASRMRRSFRESH
jgi:hypothetical protein